MGNISWDISSEKKTSSVFWRCNGDLMGLDSDIMGIYCSLMDYEWDIPSGNIFP